MKRILWALPLVLSACTTAPQAATTPTPATATDPTAAKEAIAALNKIDALVGTGVNLVDYQAAVVEAKTLIDPLARTEPDGKATEWLQKSLQSYEMALSYWKCDALQSGITELLECRDKAIAPIRVAYPEIDAAVAKAHAEDKTPYVSEVVSKQRLLSLVWAGAEAHRNMAETSL